MARLLPRSVRSLLRAIAQNMVVLFFSALSACARPARPPFSVSSCAGSPELWRKSGMTLMRLQFQAFGRHMRVSVLREMYSDPKTVVILIRDTTGRIYGNNFAHPSKRDSSTAYAASIATDKRYRHGRLGWLMMRELEEALVRRSYERMDFDAVTVRGWADSLARWFDGYVIESFDHASPYGPQRYFCVRLPRPGERSETKRHRASSDVGAQVATLPA